MKKLLIGLGMAALCCMFSLEAEAQTRKLYDLMYGHSSQYIEGKWEYNQSLDRYELNYYNNDFCSYVLSRKDDKNYLLHVGKNTVFSYKRGEENLWKTSSSYTYWRGQFVKDFKLDTPYALPVKEGRKIKWIQDERQPQKTLRFLTEPFDTVYAVRGGVACRCEDNRSLLVMHDDNTMALYISMDESFIYPGDEIEVGQPVGTSDHGGLGITWFFLDKNRFVGDRADGYPYAHFVPFFSTGEGCVQTEAEKEYECVLDDVVMTLDMSKAARKKYLKLKK